MIFDLEKLIDRVLQDQMTEWHGIHGLSHWGRVHSNGMKVAAESGANTEVVELFAFFHDAQRVNDGYDQGHGFRGAEYAKKLRGTFFDVSDDDFALLYEACRDHTDVNDHDNVTIQTCFDADRLDLGRVDIRPDPKLLCTDAAKNRDMIDWCTERAQRAIIPEIIRTIWHNRRGDR